jgi:signal transducing adaptor molecule
LTDGNATAAGGAGLTVVAQAAGGYSVEVAQSQPEQQQQQSPQQQQEHNQQGYDRQSVSYGVTSSPISTTTNFQAQEHQQLLGRQSLDNMTSSFNTGGSPHSANPGYSPNVAATPSWVLPKKDSSNSPGGYSAHSVRAGNGGMSDGSNGAAAGAQGLTGRLAGVTLTDPGSASA